ncbi:unnamed protein product [Parajaminaea phylloscopi]
MARAPDGPPCGTLDRPIFLEPNLGRSSENAVMVEVSIVSPVGYSRSSCGYCSPSGERSKRKSSCSFGLWAHDLSPSHYQLLCDKGWRRSGSYIYKPDLDRTCCKQVSIKLDAAAFKLGTSHKRTFKRVLESLVANNTAHDEAAFRRVWGKGRGKGKYSEPTSMGGTFDFLEHGADEATKFASAHRQASRDQSSLLRSHPERQSRALAWRQARVTSNNRSPAPSALFPPDMHGANLSHRLKASLVPATSTQEKYELFRRYQQCIHKERPEDVSSRQGFERFLCESPVRRESPPNAHSTLKDGHGRPLRYGLYHMEWRITSDNDQQPSSSRSEKLIAVGVLDILPSCLSSVYLFYDPAHSEFELGRLSALKEIELTRQLHTAAVIDQPSYYMGFYIHNCGKMKYKGGYRPSWLLDAQSNEWVDLETASRHLDQGRPYGWNRPVNDIANELPVIEVRDDAEAESDDEAALPIPPPPGIQRRAALDFRLVSNLMVLQSSDQQQGVRPLGATPLCSGQANERDRQQLFDCVSAVGPELSKQLIFFV